MSNDIEKNDVNKLVYFVSFTGSANAGSYYNDKSLDDSEINYGVGIDVRTKERVDLANKDNWHENRYDEKGLPVRQKIDVLFGTKEENESPDKPTFEQVCLEYSRLKKDEVPEREINSILLEQYKSKTTLK